MTLDWFSLHPGEQLRLESAASAVKYHRRAQILRPIVLGAAATIALIRFFAPGGMGTLLEFASAPATSGACLLASILAFSSEWTSRSRRDDAIERYADFVERLESYREQALQA